MQKTLADQPTQADGGDPGLTLPEWAEAWNCGTKRANIRLKELSKAGHLIAGRRRTQAIDGRMIGTPVYRAK